ncbi:MAG: UbiD family decarboxylase [Thermodesulfobacteriota bacterium]
MYADLREWLEQVEAIGELKRISGAHWDREMGPLTQLMHEKFKTRTPALLFDQIPDYPRGFRTLYGHFSTPNRVALTLGLPLNRSRIDMVRAYQEKINSLKPVPPKFVDDGPVLENVQTGDDVNVLQFPSPRHHERDSARYIGTACAVITRDPDREWYNLGTYRSTVYDEKTVGLQITGGKHGRIHRDKYFSQGKPMQVAIMVGQDPLFYMLGASPVPENVSELDFAGGIRGKAVEVIRGRYTGFPIPATAEIVIEGETLPGDKKEEGPFGEWTGYYCSQAKMRPYVRVKSIMYRNDPILCCAPQHKPIDETVLLKSFTGSAAIWENLNKCDIPDVRGVWQHEAGMGVRFLVISIRQRYHGHARQVLHVASSAIQAAAYNGKWVVVVDEDIDPSDIDQVLWAMTTRVDAVEDIDIIKKAWSSGRDPLVLPEFGNYNNRILVDACRPYHRVLRGDFPPVVDVSEELKRKLTAKFKELF